MSLFQKNNPNPVTERIAQPRLYNRKERRKGAFVIINSLGHFGRWNKTLKQMDWQNIDLEEAAMYSYDTITLLFRIDITKDLTVIKVVRGKDGKRKLD